MIRAAIALVLLVLASSMTLTDEQQEAEQYASMVCAGHWPDYQQLEPECNP